MSKKFIYMGLMVSSIFISCKKEGNNTPNTTNNDTIKEILYSSDPDYVLSNKNAQELIEHFEKEQNDLEKKLKKATKKEAEALYVDYYKRLTTIVDSLNMAENNTLLSYHKFINENKPDSILRKESTYEKVNLYFRKIDSTTYDFRIKPGYFYNLFHKKISKEYEEYMKLRYLEHTLQYDLQVKGETITIENQRDLVIKWEQFITKNKDFKFIDLAKKSYADNITMYLFGTAIKPTFEVTTKKLYVENEQEYISFVKKSPNLISADITKAFLKHFYANDKNFTSEEFYVDLKEFTKKEIAERIK